MWQLFWIMDGRELKEETSLLTYYSKVIVKEDKDNLWILTMFTVCQLTIKVSKHKVLKETYHCQSVKEVVLDFRTFIQQRSS